MERTTIYLDKPIKLSLMELSSEESKKKGKRVAIAEMIREALIEYLERKGKHIEGKKAIVKRMLLTKGALGDDFKKRVKETQKEFKNWKI